jgi:poly(hydroxyalkanoate) depolymerase family esterase
VEHGWIRGSARAASGSRTYKLWVPSTLEPGKASPLVMLLHGCTLDAQATAEISGMSAVADANRFLVVYPEQSRRANLMKCWNWFHPKHQTRDQGEPAILAAIIEQICSRFKVDSERIYVAGVSAGGAMAVIAGATYPDLFAGIAVCAGCEFRAATSVTTGLAVMKHGGPNPLQQGQVAFEAMRPGLAGKRKRRMPLIAFHGTADTRVNPVNTEQIIAQWSATNACLAAQQGETDFALSERTVAGQVPAGYAYTRTIYLDQAGHLLLERWMINGLGHAWPGSPQPHKYGDPKGPAAAKEIWRFFNEARSNLQVPSVPAELILPTSSETTA